MFTRIFKPAAALVAVALLAGCFSPTRGITTSSSVRAGGVDINVSGPVGFCVDEHTTEQNRVGAFVFLSDCAQRSGDAGPTIASVPISAVLTAAISPSGLVGSVEHGVAGALGDLEAFLRTPLGTVTLGKGRDPSAVSIIDSFTTENALFILVQDSSARTTTGESPRYWRAFTEVNGRLAALSITGFSAADPNEARTRAIALAFVNAMQSANRPPNS